jgi:hypothetical protein
MATMPLQDQQGIAAGVQRYFSSERTTLSSVDESEWLTAIQATDQWIDDNQASYNAVLPPSIQALSIPIKTLLFCGVAMARVSIGFARRVFDV